MNISCKSFISGALLSVLFFASAPLASAAETTANPNRCENLAGREKSRCEYVFQHSGRLRVRAAARSPQRRNNTVRDRRVIRTSTTQSNIRRIGNHDLARLRRHDKDGGRSRRYINMRDEMAREACKDLESTEKYQCIRTNWRGLSRGNTR